METCREAIVCLPSCRRSYRTFCRCQKMAPLCVEFGISRYNRERPHQALGMKMPADVYVRSLRVYRGLDELAYPFHDTTITVTHCGRIC